MTDSRLMAIVVALVAAVPGGSARAQHHHHGGATRSEGGREASVQGMAGLSIEMGQVDAFGETRDYQGLAVMGGARFGAFELSGHVPFYRIELGPESHAGLGDVHAEAGWIALADPVEAGLSLAVMPPLGDDEFGLAMGHWMVMAGTFGRWTRGPVSAAANLGYDSMLGGEGHADHGVPAWPPVAPMNAHEVRGALASRVAVWRAVGVTASAAAATPIGDGDLLALVGGGVSAQVGRMEAGLEASHGLAGHTAGLVVRTSLTLSF